MRLNDQTYKKGLKNEILDSLIEGFQLISYDWRYLYVNETVANHGKSTKEELLGHTMMEKYPGIDKTPLFNVLEKCMKLRVSENYINEFTFPDGSLGWFELRIQPVPEGIFILSYDITDKVKAERELQIMRESLEQKVIERTAGLQKANDDIKMLLAEMHHRVKNNLQLISSILSIQASSTNNNELKETLENNKSRIQSIALVHQSLYQQETLSEVNMDYYFNNLFKNMAESILDESFTLKFKINCDNLVINVHNVVPLGLLINELATNSIKHAFKNKNEGFIELNIKKHDNKGGLLISYKDNGNGFNINTNESNSKSKGIGTTLINGLVSQLNGSIGVTSGKNGTTYIITSETDG